MITLCQGDIFESKAQTLVNPVNCVGVMGKGLALTFKQRFPEVFRDYQFKCALGRITMGRPYLYRRTSLPWVLNFPTKKHWREKSTVEGITEGLERLTAYYAQWGITSLAVPALGAGNGGLQWGVIGPVIYAHLGRLDIPVELYVPYQSLTKTPRHNRGAQVLIQSG